MKRLLRSRRFTVFLFVLVIVHLTVWVQVFQRTKPASADSGREDQETSEEDSSAPDPDPALGRDDSYGADKDPAPEDSTDTRRYAQFPTKPFEPDEAKMVLVLAYQRVGSSFFGKIFDLNPDIFYVYEPLDALYQAMYGTTSGYNVPSDITSYANGTDRFLPAVEIAAVSDFLSSMMSCKLDNLPTEFFIHNFWSSLTTFMPSWTPYLTCLRDAKLTSGRRRCAGHLKPCPSRFGANLDRSDKCRDMLWPKPATDVQQVSEYHECMAKIQQLSAPCTALMDTKCLNTSFRATKTVRATMESVEALIQRHPNLRVVHLYRDPRPVVVSRMVTRTYRGIYSGNSTVRESELYCGILHRDLLKRKLLERKYPGVFFEVIYEDFVKHPAEYAKAVYRFLDMAIPESLVPWVEDKTRGNKKVKRTKAPKWQRTLSETDASVIKENCKEMYEIANYKFD